MFEKLSKEEMVGGVIFVEDDQLFAKLPDGRKVLVGADESWGLPFVTFEVWS